MYRLFAVCLFKSLPCPDVCRVFFLSLPSFIVYHVSILVIAVQYTLPCVYLARNTAEDTLPCSIPNIHTAEYSITVALDFPIVHVGNEQLTFTGGQRPIHVQVWVICKEPLILWENIRSRLYMSNNCNTDFLLPTLFAWSSKASSVSDYNTDFQWGRG
jgi:hypothetical protein